MRMGQRVSVSVAPSGERTCCVAPSAAKAGWAVKAGQSSTGAASNTSAASSATKKTTTSSPTAGTIPPRQPLGPLGQAQPGTDVFQHFLGQALQQRHAPPAAA